MELAGATGCCGWGAPSVAAGGGTLPQSMRRQLPRWRSLGLASVGRSSRGGRSLSRCGWRDAPSVAAATAPPEEEPGLVAGGALPSVEGAPSVAAATAPPEEEPGFGCGWVLPSRRDSPSVAAATAPPEEEPGLVAGGALPPEEEPGLVAWWVRQAPKEPPRPTKSEATRSRHLGEDSVKEGATSPVFRVPSPAAATGSFRSGTLRKEPH